MATVAIIGAGDIGAAAAQALAARERVGRVVLIDSAAHVAAGKALDIQQSGPIGRFDTALEATDDPTRSMGAAACVIADRVGAASVEWHGEDGLAMLERLSPYLAGAPLVFAGTQQGELMLRAATELGVAPTRLIGSAPEAFASAARGIAALEAQCSPDEISLAVLGGPGACVIPWSEAAIGGQAIDRVLTQAQLARVEARVARLWPPGPYTLGVAAARTVEALVTTSRRRVAALTVLQGEFGVRNRIGALPVLLNRHGIADVRVPELNTRERVLVETSLGGR